MRVCTSKTVFHGLVGVGLGTIAKRKGASNAVAFGLGAGLVAFLESF
jgi:hypothetical protein